MTVPEPSPTAAPPFRPARRPCRRCHVRTRPLVPVGCARWWDLCYRCARSVTHRELVGAARG